MRGNKKRGETKLETKSFPLFKRAILHEKMKILGNDGITPLETSGMFFGWCWFPLFTVENCPALRNLIKL
jgi:hypothetical protein